MHQLEILLAEMFSVVLLNVFVGLELANEKDLEKMLCDAGDGDWN